MRRPSPRVRGNTARLYRYRPGQDPDAGAVADESSLIAADVACSVQPVEVEELIAGKRVRQVTHYEVLLAADYDLRVKDLILWTDTSGVVRSLFVIGQADQAGRGGAWKVAAKETR